jgi:hypothetical protein
MRWHEDQFSELKLPPELEPAGFSQLQATPPKEGYERSFFPHSFGPGGFYTLCWEKREIVEGSACESTVSEQK